MNTPNLSDELTELLDAVSTTATNAGNIAWHIAHEGSAALVSNTPSTGPDGWPIMLASVLARLNDEHPELVEHFRATAEKCFELASSAHNAGTQQCLECDQRTVTFLDKFVR